MDFATILGFIIAASASILIGYLTSAFGILASIISRRVVFSDTEAVRKLDQLFVQHGRCQTTTITTIHKPYDGAVAFWPHPAEGLRCLIVGWRKTTSSERAGTSTTYELFILGPLSDLLAYIRSDPRSVVEMIVHFISAYRTSQDMINIKVPPIAQDWQHSVIKKLVQLYRRAPNDVRDFGVSVLIYGPTGAGKTIVAHFLAQALRGRSFKTRAPKTLSYSWCCRARNTRRQITTTIGDPMVASGDISLPGASLNLLGVCEASAERPVVLLLDEFDRTCQHASKSGSTGEGVGLAENKTTLNGALDQLSKTNHVCTVATMNSDPFKPLNDELPLSAPGNTSVGDLSFIRAGRFDIYVEVVSNGIGYTCNIRDATK